MSVATVRSRQGTDLGPLINAAAEQFGLVTRALTAQLIAESELDERAERWGVWPDVSFGLGQQTAAYAPVGDHSDSAANIALLRAYYADPAHAIHDCAAQMGVYWQLFHYLDDEQRYYETASRYNGGPGLAFADNPNQMNIMRGWTEAAQYESEAPMPDTRAFNANEPTVAQSDPWSCSVAAASWALHSIGIDVDYHALETEELRAGIVSTVDGLLVAAGGPLAGWLAQRFGIETDYDPGVSWEWLQEHAGTMPILLGGRRWGVAGHWVGVRGVEQDVLHLANPAEGYAGIWTTLTAEQFRAVGPCSAVWIVVEEAEDMAQMAEVQRIARDEIIRNIEKALAVKRLPAAARDALRYGALPAAQTLARGLAPDE